MQLFRPFSVYEFHFENILLNHYLEKKTETSLIMIKKKNLINKKMHLHVDLSEKSELNFVKVEKQIF